MSGTSREEACRCGSVKPSDRGDVARPGRGITRADSEGIDERLLSTSSAASTADRGPGGPEAGCDGERGTRTSVDDEVWVLRETGLDWDDVIDGGEGLGTAFTSLDCSDVSHAGT